MIQPEQQQSWKALLQLEFKESGHQTVLAKNQHQGPLMVQRPLYPEHQVCHVCILHPPGGVVGGDQLEISAHAGPGTHCLITTPGATKFYRSQDCTAVQNNTLTVNGGVMEWFPQDSILFPGACAQISSTVHLHHGGQFTGWEVTSLGLPTQKKIFETGRLNASFEIYRERQPLLIDRLHISGEQQLNNTIGLRQFPVTGIFLATGASSHLVEQVRKYEVQSDDLIVGTTRVGEVLISRYLGSSTFEARSIFQKIWTILRPILYDRDACPPRIWAT